MSTVGSRISETGAIAIPQPESNASRAAQPGRSRTLTYLGYADLVALALALPVFLLAGFPLAGYAVGSGAWVIQRAVQVTLLRRAAASDDPRTVVGIAAASMIARGWFCALAIFGVGLADNSAGLAAAVLVIAIFTVYFTAQMLLRPFEPARAPGTRKR